MKYIIKVQEVLSENVEVNAKNIKQAIEKVQQMSDNGDIEAKEIEDVFYTCVKVGIGRLFDSRVTFDFHSPKDQLPSKSGKYLCLCFGGGYTSLEYSLKHKTFNAHDREAVPEYAMSVKLWAEIPEAEVFNL